MKLMSEGCLTNKIQTDAKNARLILALYFQKGFEISMTEG